MGISKVDHTAMYGGAELCFGRRTSKFRAGLECETVTAHVIHYGVPCLADVLALLLLGWTRRPASGGAVVAVALTFFVAGLALVR
jgi:hypothetical protein